MTVDVTVTITFAVEVKDQAEADTLAEGPVGEGLSEGKLGPYLEEQLKRGADFDYEISEAY